MSNASPALPHAVARTDARRLAPTAGQGRTTAGHGDGRWELEATQDADRVRGAALLDRLEAMPYDDWRALGRRAAACASDAARTAAAAALAQALERRRLGVTAWLVRDAVATAVHTAPGRPRSTAGTLADARLLATARDAAALAVLAQLARPWLRCAKVAALLTPLKRVS